MKEAVIAAFLETAGSETDSETTSKAGSGANAGEKVSWIPPAAGHAMPHELIQKVLEQRDGFTGLVLTLISFEHHGGPQEMC